MIRRTLPMAALAALSLALPLRAQTPPSDTLRDYSHSMAVQVDAGAGVTRLRLPREVYLHARSPQLNDVRLFDGAGNVLPIARLAPAPLPASVSEAALKLFPVTGVPAAGAIGGLDIDVRTGADGRVLGVRLRTDQPAGSASALAALVLEVPLVDGQPPAVDSLRFSLPPSVASYHAELWLEVSDDLKRWEALGATSLQWLVNDQGEHLADDLFRFDARRFRYARISWRQGTPLQFAAIHAGSTGNNAPVQEWEQLVLAAGDGREPGDLMYAAPPAVLAERVALDLGTASAVLAARIGSYHELAPRRLGDGPRWQFAPDFGATFYRIAQGQTVRASGEVQIGPTSHASWVLRPDAPTTLRPALRLAWSPATLVFLASGKGPYTLAFGRADVRPAWREPGQVAPGFSAAELAALKPAQLGPLQGEPGAPAVGASATAGAATTRMLVLWAVLLLGVGVLALLAWRLVKATPEK